jgi:hypothetical protein
VHSRYTVLAKVNALPVLQQLLPIEPLPVRLLSAMPPWRFLLLLLLLLLLLSVQSSVPGVDDRGVQLHLLALTLWGRGHGKRWWGDTTRLDCADKCNSLAA